MIDPSQAKISVLTRGVQGTPFNFSHKFREHESIQEDLGMTLVRLSEITPGGILVFFSSYNMLKRHYEFWEEHKIIKQLEKIKGVYQEPRESSHYKFVISAYYQDIQSGKGAIIFAVCRGKISEGLDFSDDAARAVILVGIPYPLVIDPKTIMKKYYLDNKSYNAHKLSGQKWYC